MLPILIKQNLQQSQYEHGEANSRSTLPKSNKQEQYKTTMLLGKTLRFLNKNKDLSNFTKRIVIPKVKRHLFLEEQYLREQKQRATRLLLGGVRLLENSKGVNRKQSNQHDIYQQTQRQMPSRAKYQSIDYRTNKKLDKNYKNQQNTKSLSKIQLLTNVQKQQTICQHKYQNQDYIFLNLQKMGQSRQIEPSQLQQSSYNRLSTEYIAHRYKGSPKNTNHNSPKKHTRTVSLGKHQNSSKAQSLTKYDKKRQNMQNENMFKSIQLNNDSPIQRIQRSQSYMQPSQNPPMGALIKLIKTSQSSQNKQKKNPLINAQKLNSKPVVSSPNQDINISFQSAIKSFLSGGFNPTGKQSNRTQNNSTGKSKYNNATILADDQKFNSQIQLIKKKYFQNNKQTQCLHILLSGISKDPSKDTIRIYKQQFQKIYSFRYGRDRITSFLDYQYIEDYGSLYELFTETILEFRKQEVLLFSFLMLDFDNDGLISHSDLFKTLTLMDKNILVKKNIYTILKYVKEKNDKNGLHDVISQDYTKKENLTIKKYKFMMYMKQKKKLDQQYMTLSPNRSNTSPNKSLISPNKSTISPNIKNQKQSKYQQTRRNSKNKQPSGSIHSNLFTLRKDQRQGSSQFQYLKSFIDSISKNSKPLINGSYYFYMNYQRFKSIYKNQIPQIYYDLLYAGFGFKDPELEYQELDYQTPLIKPRKVNYLQEISKYDILLENLAEMRETKVDLNAKLIKPNIKRNKRIKSMLS